jgi:hypothetical protein
MMEIGDIANYSPFEEASKRAMGKTSMPSLGAPASLGSNDLSSISKYIRSASDLGLSTPTHMTSFMSMPSSMGGLSAGTINMETAEKCVNDAIVNGLIAPQRAYIDKAMSLLNNAKALGMTANNVKEKVMEIQGKANKFGIKSQMPMQERQAKKPEKQEKEEKQEKSVASLGPAITGHKLRFAPLDFIDILDVTIAQDINEHGHFYIKGALQPAKEKASSKTPDDEIIQKTDVGTAVALYSVDEEGKVEVLFQGIVLNIKQVQTTDLKIVELEAASPSYILDIQKESRSFQRMSATYDDVIAIVNAGRAQIQNNTPTKQIGKFIVQYKETSWTFLKRMASRHNSGLVPAVNSENIQISFGVPKGQNAKTITAASYSVQKRIGEFLTTKANDITHSQPNLQDIDFICYKVTSFDRLSIGDAVDFLNHRLYVQSIRANLQQGVMVYSYTLVSENGLCQKDMFNPDLAGLSLMGQVKVITKDQIKAHIVEIDPAWDDGAEWYFPYATVFSSPSGSGWYAMPEPGDTVRVYFPTHKDEDVITASSVNRDESLRSEQQTSGADKGGDAPRSDPDKKSFSNIHGKEVLFTPDGIYITNKAGQMYIYLTDAKGITIVSDLDINFKTKANIIMNAEKNIIMNAKKSFSITSKGASIKSDESGLIEIKGEQVKAN